MTAKRLLLLALALLGATGFAIPNLQATEKPVEDLFLAVGTATIDYFQAIKSDFQKKTGYELHFLHEKGMNADSTLIALDMGTAEAAVVGIGWTGLQQLLKAKGAVIKNLAVTQHFPIGRTPVVIFTYKGGPKQLSRAQLKDLFSGKIRNWKDIPGANSDRPVQIVVQGNTNALQKGFSDLVLDGMPIHPHGIKTFLDVQELSRFVGSTPGAIGVATKSVDLTLVNLPSYEPIYRDVEILCLGEPSPGVKLLREYIAQHPLPLQITPIEK